MGWEWSTGMGVDMIKPDKNYSGVLHSNDDEVPSFFPSQSSHEQQVHERD